MVVAGSEVELLDLIDEKVVDGLLIMDDGRDVVELLNMVDGKIVV